MNEERFSDVTITKLCKIIFEDRQKIETLQNELSELKKFVLEHLREII